MHHVLLVHSSNWQSEWKQTRTLSNLFHPNSYTPTRGASRSRLSCVAHLATLASTVFQLSCVKSYIQTDGACRYTSLHYVIVCNYISLNHIFTQPVGSLMYRCCSRSITDSSIRSTSHWRCDWLLAAAYIWIKACGCSDVWSSVISSSHCCCGSSLTFSRAVISSTPMTASWDKKSTMLAGLTLVTAVWCSWLNLNFNVSFESVDN